MLQEIIIELKKFKLRIITQEIYDNLNKSLEELRNDYVKSGDQESAKTIWCYNEILEIQATYTIAFYQMKKKEFYQAWCTLEKCEKHLNYLVDHFKYRQNGFFLNFIKNQVTKFQEIYPRYIFHSIAYVIKKSRCNICGIENSIRHHCGHFIGEIYDGKRCVRIPTDFKLDHATIVANPLWKYRVLFSVDELTNEEKDRYDYRVLEHLIERLDSPVIEWDYRKSKLLYPQSYFNSYNDLDTCPCGSRRNYGECCKEKKGVLMNHYDIIGLGYQEPRLLERKKVKKSKEKTNLVFKTTIVSADLFYVDY